MEIRNRMPDVVKLRCNACQEFLKMVIKHNWQQRLYDIAKEALNIIVMLIIIDLRMKKCVI